MMITGNENARTISQSLKSSGTMANICCFFLQNGTS